MAIIESVLKKESTSVFKPAYTNISTSPSPHVFTKESTNNNLLIITFKNNE